MIFVISSGGDFDSTEKTEYFTAKAQRHEDFEDAQTAEILTEAYCG